MHKTENIIVGNGFAALFMAHQFIKNKQNFILFSDGISASSVSAGIINPVILKKFTIFNHADEQITVFKKILSEMKSYLDGQFYIDSPVYRIFHDEDEKKTWLKKIVTNTELNTYLNPEFENLENINNPFGCGKINDSGRFIVSEFMEKMFQFLEETGKLKNEKFDYSKINYDAKQYDDVSYDRIIFCEGVSVKNNPYFSKVPVVPNKGYALEVTLSEEHQLKKTVKKKHFLFPIDANTHYYGGTYDRFDLNEGISPDFVEELKTGIEQIYPYPYEIINVKYGFRATVADRNPILGNHPSFQDFYILNGLGTRGVLNGAYYSEILYRFITENHPLDKKIDVHRYRYAF